MLKTGFYIVNAITLYRLLAAPFLLFLVIDHQLVWFKWMLALSFLTDAIDGFLARRWGVVTELGSQLDSIADDLTVLMAIIGMVVFRLNFVMSQLSWIILLTGLYLLQLVLALIRYRKTTSFHTYLAKGAAVMQGVFLTLLFFLSQPSVTLFYAAALVTLLDLLEEILLVLMLPVWQSDVKGLYWVKKQSGTLTGMQHGQQ